MGVSISPKTNVKAPQRLNLLLPWLNLHKNDARWEELGRTQIDAFLRSFDGSRSAGYVEVLRELNEGPDHLRSHVAILAATEADYDREDLQILHDDLNKLLGFGGSMIGSLFMLRFAFRSAGRAKPEAVQLRRRVRGKLRLVRVMSRPQRREYDAAGAHVLQVGGKVDELVMYLVLHLLILPGMVGAIRRCDAPARGDWTKQCGRWIARTGNGRPKLACDSKCRTRKRNAVEAAKNRNARRRRSARR